MKKSVQIVSIAVLILIVFSLSIFNMARSSGSTAQNTNAVKTEDVTAVYEKNCAKCHGKDGKAKTFKAKFNHARDLTDAEWQSGIKDEQIFDSINTGLGKMPAFGKKLSEDDIKRLVAYVRQLKK